MSNIIHDFFPHVKLQDEFFIDFNSYINSILLEHILTRLINNK